jgi:D-alanine transaminase
MELCHLNGRIVTRSEARIDPLDRGFIFGDALYEGIKVLDGALIDLVPHLARLSNGLTRVGIVEPARLADRCRELVGVVSLGSGSLYLQVSRGVAPRRHAPPPGIEPTVLILPAEHEFWPPAAQPHTAISLPDPRWLHCDVKTTSLMATVAAYLGGRGVDEILFRGPDGELREGGHTNLLVRRGDVLETHPLDGRILPGVTRAKLLELAREEGLPCVERAPRLNEIGEWREAMLCGTRTGAQPLVEVDGRKIGDGTPGLWTRQLARGLETWDRRAAAGEDPRGPA